MLDQLQAVERILPDLLMEPEGWSGLDVDYHAPRVERLWRPHGKGRIYLHRIHPCKSTEALFHPHPWPSAMLVVDGQYEMAMGFGAEEPPKMATIIMVPGSRYEMVHNDAWHYVRPVDGVAWSLMVSGEPWQREAPKSTKPLERLSFIARQEIFDFFLARYRQT